jgi:hypothetical protein
MKNIIWTTKKISHFHENTFYIQNDDIDIRPDQEVMNRL